MIRADHAALVILLIICAGKDIKNRTIPNKTVVAGLLSRAVWIFISDPASIQGRLVYSIAGACILPAFLLVFTAAMETVKGRKMLGGGDIKMLVMTGAYLGLWNDLLILFISCLTGAVHMIACKKTEIALAPHIAAAAVLIMLVK